LELNITSITNTNKTHREHKQTRSAKVDSKKIVPGAPPPETLGGGLIAPFQLPLRLYPEDQSANYPATGVRVEGRATSGTIGKVKIGNEKIKEVVIGRNQFMLA